MKTNKFILLVAAALIAFSCSKEESKPETVYGSSKTFGSGTVKSFARLDAAGKLTQIGAAFSDAAIFSLAHTSIDMALELPAEAMKNTQFKHVYLGFLHTGHGPEKIYDVPHFDVHFYTVPNEERLAMNEKTMEKMSKPASPDILPTGYIPTVPVPFMGQHWEDVKAPEFNGKPFTATMVYGTFDGNLIFQEPMISLDFLKKAQNEVFALHQPAKYMKSGMYPTEYRVAYNSTEKQFEVTIENFEMK
jgi:hypothetical protein